MVNLGTEGMLLLIALLLIVAFIVVARYEQGQTRR